jgi:hypothetical protein
LKFGRRFVRHCIHISFGILTDVAIKRTLFWDVTPCLPSF